MKLCFQSSEKKTIISWEFYAKPNYQSSIKKKLKTFLDIMSYAELKNDPSPPEDVHILSLEPVNVPYIAKAFADVTK